jgi:hypothetical protein
MSEWRVAVKLAESFKGQPTLLAVMIRTMLNAQSMQSGWALLNCGQLTDDHLAEIEAHFQHTDLPAEVRFGLASERALFNSIISEWKRLPRKEWPKRVGVFFGEPTKGSTPVWHRILNWLPYCIPRGWLLQNQVRLNRFHDSGLTEAAGRELSHSPRSPYRFIAQASAYMLGDNEQYAADVQNEVQLFRMALALERHRLRTGAFPKSLAELVPRELPSVHTDGYGEPFRYEATDEKTILLYSCGADGKDAGGHPKDDLTWRVPARFVAEEEQSEAALLPVAQDRAPVAGQQDR